MGFPEYVDAILACTELQATACISSLKTTADKGGSRIKCLVIADP